MKILYITRNGLLEPLGQSQVLSYLKGLSRYYQPSLISFEKPEDRKDRAAFQKIRHVCDASGIRWLPQRFHYRPRLLSTAWSMVVFLFLCLREVRRGNAKLIHARSYIPAAVALLVNKLTGIPFIFDMRALWPEELITAGRLRRRSFLHRAIVWLERACLARASAVVSLTHAAVDHLQVAYPRELEGQRISVIPTCADLDRFTPTSDRRRGSIVHGCIGTVLSGWFRTDWLASWLAVASARDQDAQFEIVTRDDAQQVRLALDPHGKLADRLTIGRRAPEDMPEGVRGHDLSIMFYAGGEVSELGRSPTRMAEALGCGLPVVANAGVGDVAAIIREWRVGILVEGPEPQQIAAALDALDDLKQDPELPARCRRAAEEIFSLDAGTVAYRALYAEVLAESQR